MLFEDQKNINLQIEINEMVNDYIKQLTEMGINLNTINDHQNKMIKSIFKRLDKLEEKDDS